MSQPSWQPWQGKDESSPQSRQGDGAGGGVPQSWQGGGMSPTWGGPPAPTPVMLASHADRERAVDVLRAGYGEGRLEKVEFDKRVARAYAARTVGELALLVGDLPLGPVPQPAPVTAVPRTFLPAPQPRTNGKAVGAAVCGLLCVPTFGLTGIPAVILGHAARQELRSTGEGGEGLALTGLVLGWLYTGGWALILTLLLVVGIASG
jgi:hypothetical protein